MQKRIVASHTNRKRYTARTQRVVLLLRIYNVQRIEQLKHKAAAAGIRHSRSSLVDWLLEDAIDRANQFFDDKIEEFKSMEAR